MYLAVQISEIARVLHFHTNPHKLKVDQNILGIVKNGCDQSGHRFLKLNVSQE